MAIGVVQEQHPDRTRLYKQWRELDWPIFVDSLNTLHHVSVVPIPMALDENGVVVHSSFRPTQLADFMARDKAAPIPDSPENRVEAVSFETLRANAGSAITWRILGEALFNYGETSDLGESIAAFQKAIELDPEDGYAEFALGAALRRRYESPFRVAGDAQAAVEHWGKSSPSTRTTTSAAEDSSNTDRASTNRTTFIFWVNEAREAIRGRGETPHPLAAEPMGSEIAPPGDDDAVLATKTNLDPDGQINRDEKGLVGIETLVTPQPVKPGNRVRVRLTFRLREAFTPWWNNEADNLMAWFNLPDGITRVEGTLQFPNPTEPETQELRQIEAELRIGPDVPGGNTIVPGYALYYVCEDAGGVCYYLRQNFTLSITVREDATALK